MHVDGSREPGSTLPGGPPPCPQDQATDGPGQDRVSTKRGGGGGRAWPRHEGAEPSGCQGARFRRRGADLGGAVTVSDPDQILDTSQTSPLSPERGAKCSARLFHFCTAWTATPPLSDWMKLLCHGDKESCASQYEGPGSFLGGVCRFYPGLCGPFEARVKVRQRDSWDRLHPPTPPVTPKRINSRCIDDGSLS